MDLITVNRTTLRKYIRDRKNALKSELAELTTAKLTKTFDDYKINNIKERIAEVERFEIVFDVSKKE